MKTALLPSVFVLGCERSGSTWVGNILDSHPDVEFFMEPFAPYADFFPGFPGRHGEFVEDRHIAAVRAGFQALRGSKYPLVYRPGCPAILAATERRLIGLSGRLRKRLRLPRLTADRYALLNLNTRDVPAGRLPMKRSRPTCVVAKELRANLKIPFLRKCFPDAGFIVCIRHPGAQIASIMRLWERGGLWELRASLGELRQALSGNGRLGRYGRCQPDGNDSMEALLAAWWFANYDILFGDLASSGARFMIVEHEKLSASPMEGTAQIIGFCGLRDDEQVRRFIKWSTSRKEGEPVSALDTRRDSAAFSASAIRRVPPEVTKAVEDVWLPLRQDQLVNGLLAAYVQRQFRWDRGGKTANA